MYLPVNGLLAITVATTHTPSRKRQKDSGQTLFGFDTPVPPPCRPGALTGRAAHQTSIGSDSSAPPPSTQPSVVSLADTLLAFQEFGTSTRQATTRYPTPDGQMAELPAFINEYWTAKQRQASSLHEISYRACFKPQLPRFFIERLTQPGDVVYDPFMGRGTSLLEAALLGRVPFGCDINPLSATLIRPRLNPPTLEQVAQRLAQVNLESPRELPEELLVFYHPDTLRQIVNLKDYLLAKRDAQRMDPIDDWIAMVALNRLTGHSSGFFSVYTLPPNQAVSVKSQQKINARRNQSPPPRNISAIMLKKSRILMSDLTASVRQTLMQVGSRSMLVTGSAAETPQIPDKSVSLAVTSPPFLDVVQYATDNWLRCWFLGIDSGSIKITVPKKIEAWQQVMTAVFHELHRVLKPGGHVAFEVGEVHAGKTRLEEAVLPCGVAADLEPLLVLINDQKFTKTANCWGVDNMSKGTNSNRIVLFRKPGVQAN